MVYYMAVCQIGSKRFLRNQNNLSVKTFDKRHVYAGCMNRRDIESYCRVTCVNELLMVRRDILYIPDNIFIFNNRSKDINGMLYKLCTSWC